MLEQTIDFTKPLVCIAYGRMSDEQQNPRSSDQRFDEIDREIRSKCTRELAMMREDYSQKVLRSAAIMFVGEQPGDNEDLAGKPFIGPAGKMFDQGLADAGIHRGDVYVTNAVKHFKFEQRGKRRIHSKPSAREMSACRPWLEAEIVAVKPKLIVCLGATAAQTLMGPQFRITKDRGKIMTDQQWAPALLATNHPSAILRVPDAERRAEAYQAFVHDLKIAADELENL